MTALSEEKSTKKFLYLSLVVDLIIVFFKSIKPKKPENIFILTLLLGQQVIKLLKISLLVEILNFITNFVKNLHFWP